MITRNTQFFVSRKQFSTSLSKFRISMEKKDPEIPIEKLKTPYQLTNEDPERLTKWRVKRQIKIALRTEKFSEKGSG